jgi:protein TonB
MKAKLLIVSLGISILFAACSGGSDTKATDSAKAVVADTTTPMPKDTVAAVQAPPPVDSAAITREYLAARKTTKKPTAKPKKQGTNEVVMYSEPPMETHEALEQKQSSKGQSAPTVMIHTKEYVYYIPSQKPAFPGGDAALSAFINKNIEYPEQALKFHVEGTVFAEVYLDSIGNVTSVEIPGTHFGSGLEDETVSVLMRSPRWHPAKENGQMVKSKVTVPVTFKIEH